ncbi:MAG: hypothetical protein ACF8QF_03085 [Phycisphaerales bacterium]
MPIRNAASVTSLITCTLATLSGAALAIDTATPAYAQAQNQPTREQLLSDFNHYVLIRNDDLALANARALLERGMEPVEFVALIEDSGREAERFEDAIRRAMVVPALEGVSGDLFKMFEQGKLDRARDPNQIAQNIQFLIQNPRARLLAAERLRAAGEYAVPQLLQVLVARSNPALETEVQRILISMGADAVAPLSAALLDVDPITQERLARALGYIGSRASLPYLASLRDNAGSEAAATSAREAILRIATADDDINDVASLYLALAEAYYAEQTSLTRFPREEHQLLWSFDPGVGLFPTAIRTPVFHETRAMALAETTLALDPTMEDAAALWIASNFSREIDSPAGYTSPAYDRARDAKYYAVASGARISQMVLARALEDSDTPLARRTLEALRLTAGGSSIAEAGPLTDALVYPDRRVQYEAALALASARPATPFPGAERVVPLLASAVRTSGDRFAVVIARAPEEQQRLNDLLSGMGFTVLAPASTLSGVATAVAEAPGVDLVVTSLAPGATRETIAEASADPRLRAAPLLALLPGDEQIELFFQTNTNERIAAVRAGVNDQQFAQAVEDVSERALGPAVGADEAYTYAYDSLSSLRDLAVSGGSVLDPLDAARSLVIALDEIGDTDLRYGVADVLSNLNSQSVQQALMTAAMDEEGDTRVDMLDLVAHSAKRFGNMLDRRQIASLGRLASEGGDDEATAAAALLGALNLDDRDLATLILEG